MSGLEDGVEYELCLKVTDKAGNVTTTVKDVIKSKDDILAKRVIAKFHVKRPEYEAHSESHIVFPANINKIELMKWGLDGEIPSGDTQWYCDQKLVSSEQTWTKNIPGVDSGTHGILAVVHQDNAYYYCLLYTSDAADEL